MFRITAEKSEYSLHAAVLDDPGKLVLGSAYMTFEAIVVGHLHHLIERLHRDALQRGLQVKTLPEPPGFQQLRFVIAVWRRDDSEPRRGRAVLALGRFEPLHTEIAQPGFGERERDTRLPFRHSQPDQRKPVALLVNFFERVTEPVMAIFEELRVGDVTCGRFSGTIFLDEIGELEIGLQAKLLRVLEEGAFRRVGGLKDLPLDVRVIAASNRDLKTESEAGRFRLDLYYRLSVIQIDLPPLRERGDDLLLLTGHYIKHFNEKLRKRISGVTAEVAEIFRRYRWPGNVRELRNVVERAMILEDEDMITENWLPHGVTPEAQFAAQPQEAVAARAKAAARKATDTSLDEPFRLPPEGVQLESVEMSLVEQAMRRSGGNQTRAAELLGISRDELRYRLKKLEGAAVGALRNGSEI